MADYEGIDTTDYEAEVFQAYSSQPVSLRKRDIWVAAETARQPTTTTGANVVRLFRGIVGGQFVFSTGSPPTGATDVVVITEVIE